MARSSCLRMFLSLAVVLVAVAPLHAQSTVGALPIFQGPPGARALGIGGAFIGVADDATAAESNPAGLTILSRPELSLHFRSHSIEVGPDEDSAIRPSFASYAAPAGPLVWSIYYTSAIDFNTSSTFVDLLETGDRFRTGGEFKVQRFGIAAAFRPVPLLALGGAVGATRLNVNVNRNYFGPGVFDGVPVFSESNDAVEGSDTGVSFNLGALINPGGRLSAGVVYKREASLEAENIFKGRICARCTANQLQQLPIEEFFNEKINVPIPDVYGAGLAFRPFARGLIAVDYTVQNTTLDSFDVNDNPVEQDVKVNSYSVGGEYLIGLPGGKFFVPIRVGYAREDDKDFEDSANFAEDATTTTFGTGLVFGGTELAVALSKGETITFGQDIRQVIFSVIRRF